MRFSGKTDVTLWLGVIIALLVVFQQPIEYIFRLGRQIEERYGLAVVPGLVVLALVLAGHFAMARLRVSTERKRRAETSRLVTMAHALTGATGMDHLRDLLRQHLSEVVGTDLKIGSATMFALQYRSGFFLVALPDVKRGIVLIFFIIVYIVVIGVATAINNEAVLIFF